MTPAAGVTPTPVRRGLVLAAFALVIWGIWPRAAGRTPSSAARDESVDGGYAALLHVAERLDLGCEPWERALDELPDDGTLLLLAPEHGPADHEVASLLTWVRTGGTLIYVPPRASGEDARRGDALLDALELQLVEHARRAPRTDSSPPDASHADLLGSAANASDLAAGAGRTLIEGLPRDIRVGERWLTTESLAAERLIRGRGEHQEHAAHVFFERFADSAPRARVAAMSFPVAGRVHVLSDPSSLRNDGLGPLGLGLPLIRALALAPEPRFVDRRARISDGGFTNPVADLARASGSGFGRFVLLSLAALGLLAWRRALPLGSPREAPAPAGRSSLEHVRALAGAWELSGDEAGAARRVAEALSLQTGSFSIGALRARLALWERRRPELATDIRMLTAALDGRGRSLDEVNRAATRVRELSALAPQRTRPHGEL